MNNLPKLAIVCALSLIACAESTRPVPVGGGDPTPPPMTTPPATPPPSTPGTPDAAPPSMPDASVPSTPPPPPMADAGSPSTPPPPPMMSGAGEVSCGEATCTLPAEVCCVSLSGMSCTPDGGCSGFGSAPGYCDGPEDCSAGDACCITYSLGGRNGAFCEAGCAEGSFTSCNVDSDCAGSDRCIACMPPTGGFVDIIYNICSASERCPSPFSNP